MRKQKFQKICLNGHQISATSNTTEIKKEYCEKCGKEVITKCPKCNKGIHGETETPGIVSIGFECPIPNYCKHCGEAYPWIATLIENITYLFNLDEKISQVDIDIIKEALPNLISETSTTPVYAIKFKNILSKTTTFVKDAVYKTLVDVLSESVKKSIF